MPALVFTKLVRDIIDVSPNGGDRTIGQIVDDMISLSIDSDEELHKVELMIDPDEWTQMKRQKANLNDSHLKASKPRLKV